MDNNIYDDDDNDKDDDDETFSFPCQSNGKCRKLKIYPKLDATDVNQRC